MSHDNDHEPYVEDYFFCEVTAVTQLTPSMIRVALQVEGGERLISTGHPDEWVRLALRPDPHTPVTLPVLMSNGEWGRPDGSQHCPNRPYTVRRWDAERREMLIDLVAHAGGVAARLGDGRQGGRRRRHLQSGRPFRAAGRYGLDAACHRHHGASGSRSDFGGTGHE
ncbi:siderophore-interacting protein [Rhizobium sp. AN69]|uniref:siderophore-interacting protein n=1 Tax=Rhizobium sp. AN69 TaxID=3035213 RepID=UPI002B25A3FD|nr:siderophore-interacting protein [Rhizobium sp. AN69]